ncbi:hypothetical protein K491DRAFT_654776, partial [Lophiostoma macrostomum CBS 122681]
MDPSPPQPFRFLDLPPELRLMVYERIAIKTSYHVVKNGIFTQDVPRALAAHHEAGNPRPAPMSTLVVRSIDVCILATCREIQTEAFPILQPLLQEVAGDPVRLIV